jgi:hypothetical protein
LELERGLLSEYFTYGILIEARTLKYHMSVFACMYKNLLIHIIYLTLLYVCMKGSKQMVVMSAVRALLEQIHMSVFFVTSWFMCIKTAKRSEMRFDRR